MVDEVAHDSLRPSPGAQVVEQFSSEVRAGIVTATELAVKRVTRGYIVTGVVAATVAGCVSWLVASPRPATTSVVYHHPGGTTEVCDRTADSGPPHSVFVCRLDPSIKPR
jgi:hypothetical protein